MIEIFLDLVIIIRLRVNVVDILNEVLVLKLSSIKVKKEIDCKFDYNFDKRSDIKVVLNIFEIFINCWLLIEKNVGLKFRIGVKIC